MVASVSLCVNGPQRVQRLGMTRSDASVSSSSRSRYPCTCHPSVSPVSRVWARLLRIIDSTPCSIRLIVDCLLFPTYFAVSSPRQIISILKPPLYTFCILSVFLGATLKHRRSFGPFPPQEWYLSSCILNYAVQWGLWGADSFWWPSLRVWQQPRFVLSFGTPPATSRGL